MKRVVMFAAFFWPNKGGYENYVLQSGKGLIEKGWKVDVVTVKLPGTRNEETYEGITIHRIPAWRFLAGGLFVVPKVSARNLAKRLPEYDWVITHTRFFLTSFLGVRFARKRKIPVLHIEHGTSHPKVKWWLRPGAWICDFTYGALTIALATKVAGVSEAAAGFARRLFPRKTEVVYNAIDTSFFKPKQRRESKTKTITFVGRLAEAKGVHHLIEVTRDMRGVRVIIVGSGPHEAVLKKMAHKNVEFVGPKDAEGVRGILAKTDIFVNPSYTEGLPTSVLEAGAMECAVVATDVGGTKEIIADGTSGFLVEPKDEVMLQDKIEELISNREKRMKFGKALGKVVRSRFDWSKTVEKLDKLLRR